MKHTTQCNTSGINIYVMNNNYEIWSWSDPSVVYLEMLEGKAASPCVSKTRRWWLLRLIWRCSACFTFLCCGIWDDWRVHSICGRRKKCPPPKRGHFSRFRQSHVNVFNCDASLRSRYQFASESSRWLRFSARLMLLRARWKPCPRLCCCCYHLSKAVV